MEPVAVIVSLKNAKWLSQGQDGPCSIVVMFINQVHRKVLTRNIKSSVPLHPMPTSHRIFDSRRERVSQMERSRHIWRRNNHDKLFVSRPSFGSLWVAGIVARSLPPVLPRGLYSRWMVTIVHRDLGQILLFAFGCRIDVSRLGWGDLSFLLLLWLSPLGLFLLSLLSL